MKTRIAHILIFLLTLLLVSCLKPEAIESDQRVDVMLVEVLETGGFARDVVAHNDMIFVAASQGGTQFWEENDGTHEKVFQAYFDQDGNPHNDNEVLKIYLEPESRMLFVLDKAQAFYKKLNTEYTAFDTIYDGIYSVFMETFEARRFGDGSIEDLYVRMSNDTTVTIMAADRSSGDGLQTYYLNKEVYEGPIDLSGTIHSFPYWNIANGSLSTDGRILGLDVSGDMLAVTRDELGVILLNWSFNNVDTLAVHETPGEALEVTFYDDYLLVANNWAGMGVMSISSSDSSLTHLTDVEVKGWVKHISMWNEIAVLSCGENSIFLVDLSDPASPVVDQAIEAGYTYRTYVAGNTIYAATREGVKLYNLDYR